MSGPWLSGRGAFCSLHSYMQLSTSRRCPSVEHVPACCPRSPVGASVSSLCTSCKPILLASSGLAKVYGVLTVCERARASQAMAGRMGQF